MACIADTGCMAMYFFLSQEKETVFNDGLALCRGYRRAMVNSMTAAGAVPHFHYCDEISIGPLLRLRAALVNDPALQGLKLTFLPFMLKVSSSHTSGRSMTAAYLVCT